MVEKELLLMTPKKYSGASTFSGLRRKVHVVDLKRYKYSAQ